MIIVQKNVIFTSSLLSQFSAYEILLLNLIVNENERKVKQMMFCI